MVRQQELLCVRCKQPVTISRQYYDLYERMHWLCFHLEYEHDADPDGPCGDPACPWWQIQVFSTKLAALGHDPQQILGDAITARWGT